MVSRWRLSRSQQLLGIGLASWIVGCETCPEPPLAAGVRVRITALARNRPTGQTCAPIEVGESFELVAGSLVEVPPPGSCQERALMTVNAEALPFGGVPTDSISCSGDTKRVPHIDCYFSNLGDSCSRSLIFSLDRSVASNTGTIEDAILSVEFVPACGAPLCQEELTVRVEVLRL